MKIKEKFMYILKCPFCKKPGYTYDCYYCFKNFYAIGCSNEKCKVKPMTMYQKTRNAAIKIWNKRF